jgi:hypothetical protein
MAKLRLGIIGAARIAPTALVVPIQTNADLAAKVESKAPPRSTPALPRRC